MKAPGDRNLLILATVARALEGFPEPIVFVGGCTVGLLVTSPQAQAVRPTDDVDAVVAVTKLADYGRLYGDLQARGFQPDTSEGAPICRWLMRDGLKLDLMPLGDLLGFENYWYPLALETAENLSVGGATIRVIAAPVFIATKLEALKGRGRKDYQASHDLEDIITVLDGRDELLEEAVSSRAELRDYLRREISALLLDPLFVDSLGGHLGPDEASQARLPMLLGRLQALAKLA